MPKEDKTNLEYPLSGAEGGEREVLLHSCCAPCSAAIMERLVENGIIPIVFYYNPNIFPVEEYELRKAENKRYSLSLGLEFIDADYDHDFWFDCVRDYKDEPERGRRCLECFKHRLLKTSEYAAINSLKVFTTTLSSSRHKSFEQILEAGNFAMQFFPSTLFWAENWRKNGLSQRSAQISKENEFYRQNYCGCEFGMRPSKG